jgi:mRNA interferase RelE/StbE
MWRVVYQPEALKTLRRLGRKTAARILDKLSELAQDPHAPDNNVKPLKGVNGYRLRIGDWRAIYTVQDDALIVTVIRTGPRGSVYE